MVHCETCGSLDWHQNLLLDSSGPVVLGLGSSAPNRTFLQNFQMGPNQTWCLQKPTKASNILSTAERLCYCISRHERPGREIPFLPVSKISQNFSVLEAEPDKVQFVVEARLILLKHRAGLQPYLLSAVAPPTSHVIRFTWSTPLLVLDCSALKTQFLFKTFAFSKLCTKTAFFLSCII